MERAARAESQRVTKIVTVNRPAIQLYQAWRDLCRRQPTPHDARSAAHAGVDRCDVIRAPGLLLAGIERTAVAELLDEIPGVLIAWRSLPCHAVMQTGEVWFHPLLNDRSEVRLILTWKHGPAPRGSARERTRRVRAEALLEQDLAHFKRLMES